MVYVVDTARSTSPATFMSNMLYACSLLYKTKLPLIVVFNKIDVARHDFAIEWMRDVDTFEEATENDETFMSCLTRSMGLVLEEFYHNMRVRFRSSPSVRPRDSQYLRVDCWIFCHDRRGYR